MHSGAPSDSDSPSPATEHHPEEGRDPAAAGTDCSESGIGAEDAREGKEREPDPRFEATRNATIMLVDDEAAIVDILRNVLEEVGYSSFIETTDSTVALDLLMKKKPDVVLLDVNMPQVTGLDILNGMREEESLKHIPAIVLTGATDSATKLLALGLGAADVLGKPVDPSELALRVRNTLTAKAYQDRLLNYDELTGLPNRRLFMDRLSGLLTDIGDMPRECALVLIGLDRFQHVNDSLGTEVGDGLLEAVSAALEEHIGGSDLPGLSGMDEDAVSMSRVDGDEFALIIPNLPHIEITDLLCRRLLSMLEKSFHVAGNEVQITASIGIAVYPEDGKTADTLLAQASAAMAEVKAIGGNGYQHHSKAHNAKSQERQELEEELRHAAARRELFLSIQPKLEVGSGRVSGAEGTIRWKHPKLGVVSPQKFLPIAEETGLIESAGEQALLLACVINKRWQRAGIEPIRVSVNVSGRQFRSLENLVNTVKRVLEQTKLDGEYLTLKFPEEVLMENPERHVEALQELKRLGVSLALDHFGSGLSSMSYLRRFPLDEIKVDSALVKDAPGDGDASAAVIAAIKLAKGMGRKVVAKGVDTEEQVAFLKKWGCDEFQGRLSYTRTQDWQKRVRKVAAGLDEKSPEKGA